MAFLDYKNKVFRKNGISLKEHVKTKISENLDTFLDNSQYGFDVTIDNETKRIGIMTSKISDSYDGVEVLSEAGILSMGTLFEWNNEQWLVLKRTVRVLGVSFFGEAYRCNINLKWVDENGNLKEQKGYGRGKGVFSSVTESLYKENPIIMRDTDLSLAVATKRFAGFKKDMRFILNGMAYRITSVDNLSVDGMSVLGMVEDEIIEGDDLVNQIAKYNSLYITLDVNEVKISIEEEYSIPYHVYDSGVEVPNESVILESLNESIAEIIDNSVIGKSVGDATIKISLTRNPTIYTYITINVGTESSIVNNIFIKGPDTIAWDSTVVYKLSDLSDAEFTVVFPSKVKGGSSITNNSIMISVEDKYSGVITITAINNGNTYTKDIRITTLGGE